VKPTPSPSPVHDYSLLGIKLLSFFYFTVAAVYCFIYIGHRTYTSWPAGVTLWHVRIIIRCLFHWLGWIACVGLLLKKPWALKLMIASTSVLAALAAAVLIKRTITYFIYTFGKLNSYEIFREIYMTHTYHFFSFCIMTFFALYFMSLKKTS